MSWGVKASRDKNQLKLKMSSSGCVFTLPLEIESGNFINTEEETLLSVNSDGQQIIKSVKFQGRIERHDAVKRKTVCSRVIFTLQMIKWHVLAFLLITSSLYSAFHFCLNKKDKKEVLKALSLLDDWRQLVFFCGIYLSYTVKKVGDVSSVSQLTFCNDNLSNNLPYNSLCSSFLQLIKLRIWFRLLWKHR